MANLALIDDHVLMRNGLCSLLEKLGHTIVLEAENGEQFIESLNPSRLPDLVLMDVHMPVMNGYDTALWLKKNYPHVSILALSMFDHETAIIRMIKAGAKGYVLKDCDPQQLQKAIEDVMTKGFYLSDIVNGKLIHALSNADDNTSNISFLTNISERETAFLQLVCTELTYREIADKMFVSPRTVDGYRDALFDKLQIKTRVGLALYAIKHGLVSLE